MIYEGTNNLPLKAPEPTGDDKATPWAPVKTWENIVIPRKEWRLNSNGHRETRTIEPKSPDVTEVVLPPIEITPQDVVRWEKYNDDEDPTHEAYVEFHVRERQLKYALQAYRAIAVKEAKSGWIDVQEQLRDSLWKLSNEASGFLYMADRQAHGSTNMAVLQMRIDDARALLATLPAPEPRDENLSGLLADLQRDLHAAKELLRELVAQVRGECPSLLNEDSGGDANLSLQIDNLLK